MIGCSDITKDKWGRLEYLLTMHINACKGIVKRRSYVSRVYEYFDFYAGPGIYTEEDNQGLAGELGSPLRAIRLFQRILDPKRLMLFMRSDIMTWRAWLFEPNRKTYGRLRMAINRVSQEPINAKNMTCGAGVKEIIDARLWKTENEWNRGHTYGLAFFDPNGVPDWDAIQLFSRTPHFQRIDLLINVCATGIKRVRRASLDPTLATDRLLSLDKRKIYLWDPVPGDPFQFALALCTNWRGFPGFSQSRFYDIESPEGRAIAEKINYTKSERCTA